MLINKVLLISEDYIKSNSSIDDNIDSKYIQSSIMNAQVQGLQSIIGTKLLNSLCEKVKNNTIIIPENNLYLTLLNDYIQLYLLYKTLSEMTITLAYKTTNTSSATYIDDEKLYASEFKRVSFMKEFWDNKANFFQEQLQRFVIDNFNNFSELYSSISLKDMFPNLYSSASPSIWLGGARGKSSFSPIDYKNLPNK